LLERPVYNFQVELESVCCVVASDAIKCVVCAFKKLYELGKSRSIGKCDRGRERGEREREREGERRERERGRGGEREGEGEGEKSQHYNV
jgi:hypothetical protein